MSSSRPGSSEKVELLREMYERRNPQDFAQSLHPDAELHQAPEIPDADSYYGRDEFLRGLRRWLEEWETFRYLPEEIIDLDDRILMRLRLMGRAKASGVEVEQTAFNLWRFRDGKPFRCDVFWSEQRAREAAGLPSD